MRGEDRRQGSMFSHVSLEQRVPPNHSLRQLQPLVNEALAELSPRLQELYSRVGRPSIARRSCCAIWCCRCYTRSAASVC
jgi:hypothetical protein